MLDIKDRWVLVTGASRGVGRRVAKALADHGCKLILHSRRRDGTRDLLEEIETAGNEVHSVAAELDSVIPGALVPVLLEKNRVVDLSIRHRIMLREDLIVSQPKTRPGQTLSA